jgi:Tfp pilus assembly protein PilO
MNGQLLRRIAVEKRGIVLPIVIGAAAAVLLYVLVVLPVGRKAQAYEREARQARDTLRLARQDAANARALVTGKSEAETELQRFYADVLPQTQSAARSVTYLRFAQIARDADVRAERGSAEVTHEKGSALAKLTSTFTLSGDYRDVRRFIYALETAPEFVVLEDVSLARGRNDSALAVNLRVATYFRASDAD